MVLTPRPKSAKVRPPAMRSQDPEGYAVPASEGMKRYWANRRRREEAPSAGERTGLAVGDPAIAALRTFDRAEVRRG
jgi:hypothetical protein